MPLRDYSKLKGIMAELGITQQDLARRTNMTETTMSLKFNGKAVFKQSEIQAIVDLLKIPADKIGEYFFTAKV